MLQTGQMKKRHPHKSNVLLVNITRLGDMLQATPTIAGMKMENPDCKVTVLVEKQFEAVCHTIPNIDEVMSIDLAMTVRSLAREQDGIVDAFEYVGEVVESLRSKNFDYVLNMSSSAYTALLLRLVEVKQRGGWTADDEGYRVIESDWAQLFATSVFHQNRQFNSLNLVDVFRCSADVELHPKHLLISVGEDDLAHARSLIDEASFTNSGPLVVVQAGASQGKRQWAPSNFVRLIDILTQEHNCRVVLSGTSKELSIIEPIYQGCQQENVFVAAGKTNIPQLSALLKISDILVTGDTGPMHMAVAVETPVVSLFLASAFGFETGPYSEGNIVLQPVLGCGPCNPNKGCARPDCHTLISPELLARLTVMRLKEDFRELPAELREERGVRIYRSFFDQWGFCDLESLTSSNTDWFHPYRRAYRKLWLDDLGGFLDAEQEAEKKPTLRALNRDLEGLESLVKNAEAGKEAIVELQRLINDHVSPAALLGKVSERLTQIDRGIEDLGYHFPYLGPLSRMFLFAKENISGTDAGELASQMETIYEALKRRSIKLSHYVSQS